MPERARSLVAVISNTNITWNKHREKKLQVESDGFPPKTLSPPLEVTAYTMTQTQLNVIATTLCPKNVVGYTSSYR